MEVNKIQEELARLTELVEGWTGSRDISGIERDLALDKLKKIYEAVRFADFDGESAAASVPASGPVEELAAEEMPEPEISIDLDDLLAEPVRDAEPAPGQVPVPEMTGEPIAAPADMPAQAQSPAADEERTIEESAVAPAAVDTPSEPEPEEAPVATPEPAMPEKTQAEPSAGQKENSLFDLDDLVIRHREKRRVIMSLYETDGPQEIAPKRVAEPKTPLREQAPVTPQPKETPEKVEQAAAAPQPEAVLEIPQEQVAAPQTAQPRAEEPQPASLVAGISDEQEGAAETAVSAIPAQEMPASDATPVTAAEPESESESEAVPAADPVSEPGSVSVPVEIPAPKHPLSVEPTPVLGEVMGSGVHTVAETLPAPKNMVSEIVRKERISDLKQAIGVNDKFLLVRDLFQGDTKRYEQAIDRLNAFDDLDDCIVYISENYDWNPSSDTVRFLMELLERKLC